MNKCGRIVVSFQSLVYPISSVVLNFFHTGTLYFLSDLISLSHLAGINPGSFSQVVILQVQNGHDYQALNAWIN